jgi:four helix bundle protein
MPLPDPAQLGEAAIDSPHVTLEPEKLDVYRMALVLLGELDDIQSLLPTGRAHLRDQLDRAATSIVLNIAEGAGEFSPLDKQRFYRIARRSATEVGAILDIIDLRHSVPAEVVAAARAKIVRVVSMLVRLTNK